MPRFLVGVLIFCLMAPGAATAGERVESLTVRDGASFDTLVIDPGETTTAVILFAGGKGVVNLDRVHKNGNFLVRTRDRFADAGLITAVIDAPADRQDATGLREGFRLSPEHAADVAALIAHLRDRGAATVWLVGTSRGSISAANAGARLGGAPKGPDGIVLTSSAFVPGGDPDSVMGIDLAPIKGPVLIVHHEKDGCVVSPFSAVQPAKDALVNAARVDVVAMAGGQAGKAKNVCGGKSYHGFLGIEDEAVSAITDWIKAR